MTSRSLFIVVTLGCYLGFMEGNPGSHLKHVCVLSHVPLFVTPWTVAHQAPLSMGISRQEYWSELPSPTPGDLPDPGIEHESLVSPVLAGGFSTAAPHGKPPPSSTAAQQIFSDPSLCAGSVLGSANKVL